MSPVSLTPPVRPFKAVAVGSSWVIEDDTGRRAFSVTRTETMRLDWNGRLEIVIERDAYWLRFPTKREAFDWMAGRKTSTHAPPISGAIFASNRDNACAVLDGCVAAFRETNA